MVESKMPDSVSAVVLAGGLARRMGGEDKGLVMLAERPMVSYVLDNLSQQVQQVMINANRSQQQYAEFGYPVIADETQEFAGPLAGMAAALPHIDGEWLLSAPCDCPMLPKDLAQRMLSEIKRTDSLVAVAHDGERAQHVILMLHKSLYASINQFLANGDRKIVLWYRQQPHVAVDFSDQADAFINVNTPEQCQQLAEMLTSE